MRLIFGFIFFGLLFYGIYLYFPETFQTLVSWAAKVFDFFHDLIAKISNNEKKAEPAVSTFYNAMTILKSFIG